MDVLFIRTSATSPARIKDTIEVQVKKTCETDPSILGLSLIASTHKPKLSPNGEARGCESNQLLLVVHVTNCE